MRGAVYSPHLVGCAIQGKYCDASVKKLFCDKSFVLSFLCELWWKSWIFSRGISGEWNVVKWNCSGVGVGWWVWWWACFSGGGKKKVHFLIFVALFEDICVWKNIKTVAGWLGYYFTNIISGKNNFPSPSKWPKSPKRATAKSAFYILRFILVERSLLLPI